MSASDDPNTRNRDEMTRTAAAAIGSSIAAYMKSSHETGLYKQSIQTADDASNKNPPPPPSYSASTTQNQEHILLLHPNDVLFGRGHDIASHAGNQNFRQYIEEQKVPYSLTKTRGEKNDIVDKIIEKVHKLDPPGRFLEAIDDDMEEEEEGEEEETKGGGGKKRKRRGRDGVTVALLRRLRRDIGIEDDDTDTCNTKVGGYQIADKEKVITKIRKTLRKNAPQKALSERQLKILERKKKKAEAEEAKKRKSEEQKRAAMEDAASPSGLEEEVRPKKKEIKNRKRKEMSVKKV